MGSPEFIYLSKEEIEKLLDWDELYENLKLIMSEYSMKNKRENGEIVQPVRSMIDVSVKNCYLLLMPSFCNRKNFLTLKVITSCPDNPQKYNMPSILGNVLMLDPDTGKLKAILEGSIITEWRTACASVVATRALRVGTWDDLTLAVFGAGTQGRIHIIAFSHFIKFKKIKLWNRTRERAVKLAESLKTQYKIDVEVCDHPSECARDADIIVTATYSAEPFIKFEYLKKNVMINAVGASFKSHFSELDKDTYSRSSIYTDSMDGAKKELKGLMDEGHQVLGEVGDVLNGQNSVNRKDFIIFQSLGMSLEDGVTGQMVLEKYTKLHKINL